MNWTVIERSEDKQRFYYYGPLSEYEAEDLVGGKIIPFAEWTGIDIVNVMERMLDNSNRHSLSCWLPFALYNTCVAIGLDQEMTKKYMQEILLQFEVVQEEENAECTKRNRY